MNNAISYVNTSTLQRPNIKRGSSLASFCVLEDLEPVNIVPTALFSASKQFAEKSAYIVCISVGTDYSVPTNIESEIDYNMELNSPYYIPKFIEFSGASSKSDLRENETKAKARFVLAMTEFMEESNEREASRYLMSEVESQLQIKQIALINDLLLTIDKYELKPRALVCLLRSTFRAKSFLPSWAHALSYTQKKIEASGQNSRAWLVGLINARE